MTTRMTARAHASCPVHSHFDALSSEFLADPFAVLAELPVEETPVFYAPSLDCYVVTRYAAIETVLRDDETYSNANTQIPLVPLVPEASELLRAGGHKRGARTPRSTSRSGRESITAWARRSVSSKHGSRSRLS